MRLRTHAALQVLYVAIMAMLCFAAVFATEPLIASLVDNVMQNAWNAAVGGAWRVRRHAW